MKSNVLSLFRHLKEFIIRILVHFLWEYTPLSSLELYYLAKCSQKSDLTVSQIRALLEAFQSHKTCWISQQGIFVLSMSTLNFEFLSCHGYWLSLVLSLVPSVRSLLHSFWLVWWERQHGHADCPVTLCGIGCSKLPRSPLTSISL